MAEKKGGLVIKFSDIKGGNPDEALAKHFLGGTIEMATNESARAALDFLIPPKGEGILSQGGLAPLAVTIEEPSGKVLFKGQASGTLRDPTKRGRVVSLAYHDPLYWELADTAPYTYPTGTLATICDALSAGKRVRFEVDPNVTLEFPSGGGTPVVCLSLLISLAEQAAAYLYYDPRKEVVKVNRWTPGTATALQRENVISVSHVVLDAAKALTSLKVYGRKGLKNDWVETILKPSDASMELGRMGIEADPWVREASMLRTRTTITQNRAPSAAKQYGSDLLSAEIIHALRATIVARNVSVLCGDTISLEAMPGLAAGDLLVDRVRYSFRSASVMAEIEGIRA